jgi:hypothetical protein
MLKIDWYIQSPHDFEYKNYILLDYLQSVDQSYGLHKLSPYLLWTEKLIYELNLFKLRKKEFEKKFEKDVLVFDNSIRLVKTGISEPDDIKSISEIIAYSSPILESKVKLGYKLLGKYPQILF